MIEPANRSEGAPERPGQPFGDYVLLERIAKGGMAEVFLAKRKGVEGFEKTVAIKRILPELSWNRDFVSMFINEAKIAALLSHPNIVQIFDFGKIDNYYFIAMEYVHGENLRELLRRSEEKQVSLLPDIAASIVARACAGLEHAHKKTDEAGKPLRIIHRDVSPQNVLVSYDGEVKVVDFGIAKAVAENPDATRGVLKGKLAYLSPEQIGGQALDARSDVFAMGVVFYELLAGQKLFGARDPAEILDAITHVDASDAVQKLGRVPRRLREVVRRALEGRREDRFGSAGEMQQALEDYLRDADEPGGTMQLTNLMRLLFDDKIGEQTEQVLRAELTGRGGTQMMGQGYARRIAAALGGAGLGLMALVFARPALRPGIADFGAPVERPAIAPSSAAAKRAATSEPRDLPEHAPSIAVSSVSTPLAVPAAPPASPPPSAPVARPSPPPPTQAPNGLADLERAKVALAENHPEDALAAFEKAFAIDGSLRQANTASYAKALTEDGKKRVESDPTTAARRLKAAIAVNADFFEAHFVLAKTYTRLSNVPAAVAEYREAVRIDPKSADAQFNLGFAYFSEKEYEKAREQYEKALELEPAYLADVYYNLAACYEQMKRKAEAVATLRRGLEAVPDSDLLRQRLKRLGG